jgi:hypothetical protein
MIRIEFRCLIEVNTDPQRRCYYGVYAKSEMRWTEWSIMESDVPPHRVEYRLEFWRDLNDYAVKERGQGAKREYRVINYDPS